MCPELASLLAAQIEMLKNNKTCVWIGEYCPEKKKFVLWNIFIYIYIDGRKVSRATYLPKKCSKVRYVRVEVGWGGTGHCGVSATLRCKPPLQSASSWSCWTPLSQPAGFAQCC